MRQPAICLLAILLLAGSSAYAEGYCKPMPQTEKEGETWYIPESAFTKEAANKALNELSSQVNNGVKGRDFHIENDFIMIKGYLYLAHLAEHKKQFGKVDEELRDKFCEFSSKEAHVSH